MLIRDTDPCWCHGQQLHLPRHSARFCNLDDTSKISTCIGNLLTTVSSPAQIQRTDIWPEGRISREHTPPAGTLVLIASAAALL